MIRKLAVTAVLALVAPLAGAETLDVNVGSDAVRAELSGPLSFGQTRTARYDLGYLYSDERDDRVNLVHGSLLVSGDAGARSANVQVGVGLRAAGIDLRGASGGAVAAGGRFDIRLPAYNRFGLVGHAFFAPGVLAFGDFDGYIDAAVSLDYEIIRNASVYLGYRQVRVDVDDAPGSDLRDSSPVIGLRLQF